MGTLGTFLLALAAFIGLVMLILNPGPKVEKMMRGKKQSQLETDIKTWVEEKGCFIAIVTGLGLAAFILLGYLYTFVIEPLAVIAGIVNNLGNQPLAYSMLAITAIAWVMGAKTIMSLFTIKNSVSAKVVDQRGQPIEGAVVKIDKELKVGHPAWNFTRRVFFALPTVYLLYLFLVVIGVLK